GVFNARTSGGQVGHGVVQVGDRGLETVLHSTQFAAQLVHLRQCFIEVRQGTSRLSKYCICKVEVASLYSGSIGSACSNRNFGGINRYVELIVCLNARSGCPST